VKLRRIRRAAGNVSESSRCGDEGLSSRTASPLGSSNGSKGAGKASRLQKSVRGVFPAGVRGAERRTKRRRYSEVITVHPRRGGPRRRRDKDAEGSRANDRTFFAKRLLARLGSDRESSRRKVVLNHRRCSLLIRVGGEVILVRRKRCVNPDDRRGHAAANAREGLLR